MCVSGFSLNLFVLLSVHMDDWSQEKRVFPSLLIRKKRAVEY